MLKVNDADFELYRKKLGHCMYLVPDGGFCIEHRDKCYRPPAGETAAMFHERLMRSLSLGRNVFLVEYESFDPYPDKDAVY